MNDPLIARFAAACGATGPLDLRVGLADGGVLAEGSVHQPFTLIGKHDACDVILNDPGVNPRHAWLQVIAGRVFAFDLGSRAGLVWPDGASRSGWLDAGDPVRVGPFRVALRSPPPAHPGPPPDPLRADSALARSHPVVQLDFRNGKRAKDRWVVNRLVTLVGRSEGCKLHLHAEDIAGYHCGLVLTPAGLWVVDLSGRGVVVNGERMRVAPLPHGAELWVGRFLIGCHYPALGDTPGSGRVSPSAVTRTGRNGPKTPAPGDSRGAPTQVAKVVPLVPEDEVPLGGMPFIDSVSGLPSSHIMCDAFQQSPPINSGPISAPILLDGSGPAPPQTPVVPPRPAGSAPSARPAGAPPPGGLAPLMQQLTETHGQVLHQFQQSLLTAVQLLGPTRRQPSAAQRELARIQELTGELATLQAEVTRRVLAALGETTQPPPTVSDATPPNGAPRLPSGGRTADPDEALEEWTRERVGAIRKELAVRWEKLNALLVADQSG